MLCRVPFATEAQRVEISLKYMTKSSSDSADPGEGFVIYLCDPKVAGWDEVAGRIQRKLTVTDRILTAKALLGFRARPVQWWVAS